MWVENAERDHRDFVEQMRARGVEVLELHDLLAETMAVPDARDVAARPQDRAQPGRPRSGRRRPQLPRGPSRSRPRRDPDRRPVDLRPPRRRSRRLHACDWCARRPASPSTCCRRCPTPSTPATPPAGSTAGSRSTRCTGRPDRRRRCSRRRSTVPPATSPARHRCGGATPTQDWGMATLEGGDVMPVGNGIVLVGMSERTSRQAISQVAAALFEAGCRRTGDRRRDAQAARLDAPRHRVHLRRPRLRARSTPTSSTACTPTPTDPRTGRAWARTDRRGQAVRRRRRRCPRPGRDAGGRDRRRRLPARAHRSGTAGRTCSPPSPGVVFTYDRNTHTNELLRTAGHRGGRDRRRRARPRSRWRALHDLPDRARRRRLLSLRAGRRVGVFATQEWFCLARWAQPTLVGVEGTDEVHVVGDVTAGHERRAPPAGAARSV